MEKWIKFIIITILVITIEKIMFGGFTKVLGTYLGYFMVCIQGAFLGLVFLKEN